MDLVKVNFILFRESMAGYALGFQVVFMFRVFPEWLHSNLRNRHHLPWWLMGWVP